MEGFLCGVFVCLPILITATSGDAPSAEELVSGTGRGSEYRAGFAAGYREVSKKKKIMARLGGGLLGFAAFVAVGVSLGL